MLKPSPRRLVLYPMALDLSPFTVSENLHLRDQLQELARKKQVIQLVRLNLISPFGPYETRSS